MEATGSNQETNGFVFCPQGIHSYRRPRAPAHAHAHTQTGYVYKNPNIIHLYICKNTKRFGFSGSRTAPLVQQRPAGLTNGRAQIITAARQHCLLRRTQTPGSRQIDK